MQKTRIEWCDAVWNPMTGCSRVSHGCDRCYARRMAHRLAGRFGYPAKNPFRVTLHAERLTEPGSMRKPSVVFCCSMGDLFHPDVPRTYVSRVIAEMQANPRHTFLTLTKRAEAMAAVLNGFPDCRPGYKLPPNSWWGVSCEDQETADARVPHLLKVPSPNLFVSCEPLIGPLDLKVAPVGQWPDMTYWLPNREEWDDWKYHSHRMGGIKWIIVGGETGPGAKGLVNLDWARHLRDNAVAAHVPFFFKGVGGSPANRSPVLDGKEWIERPKFDKTDVNLEAQSAQIDLLKQVGEERGR